MGQDGGGRVKGELADAIPTCSSQFEAVSCLLPTRVTQTYLSLHLTVRWEN